MDWNTLKQTLSPKQRFNRDVLWNVASLAVQGVSLIVWTYLIGKYRREDALGVFSQVYAIYIVLSQIAVGGVHASVLRHVSFHQDDRRKCAEISAAALLLSLLLSLPIAAAAYLLRNPVAALFESPDMALGLACVAPGLVFFSLNKTLLNVLNAMRHMRAFAVFSAIRTLLILAVIAAVLFMDEPDGFLPAAFTISEVVLFAGLVVYVHAALFALRLPAELRAWLGEHLSFGMRGFFSNLLSDLNTRLDVLMLGYFLADAEVGVYAVAANLSEGFYQLPVVVQRNVNPILGRCFAAGDMGRIDDLARRLRRVMHPMMLMIGLAAIAAYPLAIALFFPEGRFEASWLPFAILMVGVVLYAGYAPMGGILFQGGRPGMQTIRVAVVVAGNLALNAALIPLFEISGAAAATALTYVGQSVVLVWLARRLFGVRIW